MTLSMLPAIFLCIQWTGREFSAQELPRFEVAYREALEAHERGELETAYRKLRLASGLDPRHGAARKRRDQLREELFQRHWGEARKLLGERRALAGGRRLLAALALHPDHQGVQRHLMRLGFRAYGDEWLHRDDVIRREKTEELRAGRRARDLGLGASFQLYRSRSFRIWTDHPSGELVPLARRLLGLLEDQERAYRELFFPVASRLSPEGIDVILFERRKDYLEYGGREGTAGIFLPESVVSCFYLPAGEVPAVRLPPRPAATGKERREAFLREVFLHEVTHQLDIRILGLRRAPRWFQEGLAVRFETARFDARGRLEEPGGPLGGSLRSAFEECRAGGDLAWRLEDLIRTPAGDVLSWNGERLRQFYVRSWAFVDYLLEGGPAERAVLFDFLEALRDSGGAGSDAGKAFPEGPGELPPQRPGELFLRILARHGQTIRKAEGRLSRHHGRRGE